MKLEKKFFVYQIIKIMEIIIMKRITIMKKIIIMKIKIQKKVIIMKIIKIIKKLYLYMILDASFFIKIHLFDLAKDNKYIITQYI